MTYQQFIFKSYRFDPINKQLDLHYSYDDALDFTETYRFNFEFANYDEAVLDRALQGLFFVAGVSYYKCFLAPNIRVDEGTITQATASYLSKTYQGGLGEFFYVNKLDPQTPITFPVNADLTEKVQHNGQGQLVGIGGGKDSIVSVNLLQQFGHVSTWSSDHQKQLQPLVEQLGTEHAWVERQWDPQLLHLKDVGAFNGHIPISAIWAHLGVVTAILSGKQDVVVSNEASANEPTLYYQGTAVNHQYSKSLEFEQDFQGWLASNYDQSLRYYSLLRPLSELRIAELFAQNSFDSFKKVFCSCNRAFVHDSPGMAWDGTCPKCAFVFLALTPFISRQELEQLFSGKNLLLDPLLKLTYRQLLGIEADKPLECVGEIKECRAAMLLAQKNYPQLDQYQFELPSDYDYKALAAHALPPDITSQIIPKFQ